LEQGVGLHYKPFRLFRLIPSLAIQPLARAIFFYLASNPRSRAKVATSRQLIAGTPIRVSAPIRRRAARLSLLGLLTDQIQAWVSSTITARFPIHRVWDRLCCREILRCPGVFAVCANPLERP